MPNKDTHHHSNNRGNHISNNGWQHWPQVWYVVARSKKLKKGQVITGHLAGRQWVLYRTHSGALRAIDAFCPHMGAHLQSAKVVGEVLECGLHSCQIHTQSDDMPASTSFALPTTAWGCAERFGLIWLYPPIQHCPPLPFADIEDSHHWLDAGPQRINADWCAMICNGFDLAHMRVVHQREVVGEPLFEQHNDSKELTMTYRTRILPRGGFSSWLMKKLSDGYIYLVHTCSGSSIMVQSRVGNFQTVGVFALLPQDMPDTAPEKRQTLAFAAIGMPKNQHFSWWKLYVARWLYLSFLKKDFCVVENMRMQLDNIDDIGVQAVTNYQKTLTPINLHSRVSTSD